MKVAELQKLLLSVGEVLQVSGASAVGREMAELAGALEHYKEKTLLGLRDLLVKASEAGTAPAATSRRKAGGAPDEAKIQAALSKLQAMLARALDPALTFKVVEGTVKPMEKELSGEEWTETAKRFGLPKKQSKPMTTQAIIDRIIGQKGAYVRGQE